MVRLRSYEGIDGVRHVVDESDNEFVDFDDDRFEYGYCTRPVITSETIARGMVRGFYYILGSMVLILAGLSLLAGLVAALAALVDRLS